MTSHRDGFRIKRNALHATPNDADIRLPGGCGTPYSLQWNADLQRELPGSFIIDIAYAGSHGVKLNQPREYNALNPQYLSLAGGLQTLVANPFASLIPSGTLSQPRIAERQLLLPYPQYTSVSLVNASRGNSNYHSMALKVERRFSHGVGFLLSYTAGKLISDVPGSLSTYDNSTNAGLNTTVQNWYNLRAERSLSELRETSKLVAAGPLTSGSVRDTLPKVNAAGTVNPDVSNHSKISA